MDPPVIQLQGNMTISFDDIISDVHILAERLNSHDNAVEILVEQAEEVVNRMGGIKQFQEESNELNDVARQKSHSVLVAGIQQENKCLRELQQENRELRAALEEHQNALELIMSKYREHIDDLVQSSKLDLTSIHNEKYTQVIRSQADKIAEMAAVMEHAAALDESRSLAEQEQIKRLTVENKGLRELLQIAYKNGIIQISEHDVPVEEKEIQTESDDKTS